MSVQKNIDPTALKTYSVSLLLEGITRSKRLGDSRTTSRLMEAKNEKYVYAMHDL